MSPNTSTAGLLYLTSGSLAAPEKTSSGFTFSTQLLNSLTNSGSNLSGLLLIMLSISLYFDLYSVETLAALSKAIALFVQAIAGAAELVHRSGIPYNC